MQEPQNCLRSSDETSYVELCKVYSIAGIDPAVINHIDSPVGTRLIRKSLEEFEEDRNPDRDVCDRMGAELSGGCIGCDPFVCICKTDRHRYHQGKEGACDGGDKKRHWLTPSEM